MSMNRGRLALGLVAILTASACGTPAPTAAPDLRTLAPPPGTSGPLASSPPPTTSPAPTGADLSARPLIWFAPLPPMPTGPGREYIGSEDFMDLFEPGAAWDHAATRIGVFKLYGEWVAYHATPDELRAAVDGIRARGLALAVEMGPLDPPSECGEGIESFAGIDEGQLISRRLREAGGRLQVIALDEPYYFAHVYAGPKACRWPVERVAQGVAGFVTAMRQEWPEVVIGDTEPTPSPIEFPELAAWLDAYQAAAGEPFAFLHLDIDWSRISWVDLAVDVERESRARGVPFGIIYNGGAAASDAQWSGIAGRRVLMYRTGGGKEDHVLFQSWNDKPDHALPETDPTTFTALVDRYVDDPESLAGQVDRTNLAYTTPIVASSTVNDMPAHQAVDGDPDTIWNAGNGPPAWIRIDLREPKTIAAIRLLVAQDPPGRTRHVITCQGRPNGKTTVLGTLTGTTKDLDTLELTIEPAARCRFVRIETRLSPSWVAWREIEILAS
jgi:hypothetical protein